MKREGRQRGMIRTCPILSAPFDPRPDSRRRRNLLHAPPTAGIFAKAPSRPTNHSKFTGKCARPACPDCHLGPASKSKGAHKTRSATDTASNYGLVTWRVAGPTQGVLKLSSGFSAAGMLDYLDGDDRYGYRDESWLDDFGGGRWDDDDDDDDDRISIGVVDDDEDEGFDDGMSFCEVGIVWQQVEGDESWCLVEEKC